MTTTLATPTTGSRAETVQIVRSAGGITAWLVEDYAVPLVAFDIAFHGGAAQDPAGKQGTVALMAGLLDEGAGTMDADAYHRALDDKAIEISFSADRDLVTGRAKTLSRNLDAAVELLRLAVCEPRFDASAVERVRQQLSASIRREAKDPDALASRAWREAAFPNHPYGHPVRGTLESLAAITRDDVVEAHTALVTRGSLKIAVVGAIDADTLRATLDRAFGALPAAPRLRPIADVMIGRGGRREVIDLDIPQATLRFGTNGIPRLDDDHMAGVVLNHILGGGVFSARLFREVREKRGLAYSVYSQLATFDHASIFSGGTSTKNERAAESLSVIEDEIRKLTEDGPTADELDKAKKYLTGSYALRFDSSLKIASQLVHLQAEGIEVGYLDQRNPLIEAVTLEDTHRVARRLFGDAGLLVTVVGRPVGIV
ncbi:pitrilysin family protein [Lichenihabitans sp. Uapishka_5]|uniref:M16 family metallopeptidase n=1 Tax=Lichenihabitans sp. Uapishka_5 TaxID=3037302 RepID=UPI0029E7CD74|nr:pitrilysin family protein [Lichenihabitans sp. Uapishka_5]MDX7952543.1 pitrilysin family protein [Lichenihabitans sp. Uapishka_5]